MEDTVKKLSASRIKTLKSCSWSYWCNYSLKLPQASNSGASRGTICHAVFEFLLKKGRKKKYNRIVKAGDIASEPAINRYVKIWVKKLKLEKADYDMINEMVLVGLVSDFFVKGMKVLDPEYEFNLKNEKPSYSVRGFIDKMAVNKKEKTVKVIDYKSSKGKFEGEELDSNIQAMIYSVIAKKVYPGYKCIVNFVFLRFPKEPVQEVEFDDMVLEGFEIYLQSVHNKINNFTYSDATENFAAYVKPKGGFNGKLLCGFADRPGKLKKDGTPMWHCPYKFAFSYWKVTELATGKVTNRAEDDDFINNLSAAEFLGDENSKYKFEKLEYSGCPAHRKTDLTNF
jgi:hypothetical protein